MDPATPAATSQQLANQLFDSATADQHKVIAARVPVPSAMTRARAVQLALTVAVPILIGVLVVNFAWQPLKAAFEPSPVPAVAAQEARQMLDALVGEIDTFRKDYDHLPETLVEIGVPPHGQWTYADLGNNRYRVQGTVYGQDVHFDSPAVATTTRQEPR